MPFQMQFKYLDEIDVQTVYLPDGKIWLPDMLYKKQRLERIDDHFYALMQHLLLSIESYPYTWPLEGQKLDPYGFDLVDSGGRLSFSPTALATAQTALNFESEASLEQTYTQPIYVNAPHLTKFALTLQKASPLSEFSIQLHSIQPVRLASLIYESDLSGYSHPIQLELSQLQITQSNEQLHILFGKPILARRLTFVLAQDNLLSNTGLNDIAIEDFSQPLTEQDTTQIADWIRREATANG